MKTYSRELSNDTPCTETGLWEWLCDRWEAGKSTSDKECADFFGGEDFDLETMRLIVNHWHFGKPWNRSYKPVNLGTRHGRESVKRGLVNAFGKTGEIPWTGHMEIIKGRLWAKYGQIIGSRCIAYVGKYSRDRYISIPEYKKRFLG